MGYDDWKTREEPSEHYGVRCRNYEACGNDVSLPEWDTYCHDCLIEAQERADAHERWLAAQARHAKGVA